MNAIARFLLFLVLFLQTATVLAQPCTLYKAQDVARAKANVARYKWAQQIVAGWQRSVQDVMERDRAYFDQMIPELTLWPTYGQNCPVCVGKKSSMGECGLYRWKATEPDKLSCKYCGTIYPNSKYPETGKLVCPKMKQTFTYYETEAERAHPEDKSGKHAFRWVRWPVHTSWSGLIRTYKAGHAIGKVLPLAKLYAVTGETQYAERATWIMDRFAQVYPNYLFHSYNGTYADWPPADAAAELGRHPRAGKFPKEVIINAFGLHQYKNYASLCNGFWGAGRYSCSGGDGGTILNMTVAYDLIRHAKRADGSAVLTSEMDRRIVNDLLLAGCNDSENWADINNKCGPGRALSAAVGLLFDRPESAKRAMDGFQQLMNTCFHSDGFCVESPSYSSMHLGLMRNIPEILRHEAFENAEASAGTDRYRLALESMVRMMAPGRRYPVIGDTHHRTRPSSIWVEILADRYGPQYAALLEELAGKKLEDSGSEYALWYRDPDMKAESDAMLPLRTEWFPGWHVAVLRAGRPEGDAAFYLNGYARHGHRHYDTLGVIYYANGKELASDRGYIWDDPRNAWTASTLAHNIVTVDGGNQNVSDRHSRLELFGIAPGIEVVQASANAYAQCEQYRRTCVLVRRPGSQTYALDIFRVKGGKLHQYGFNANGRLATLSTAEPQPFEQEIRWLSNLRSVEPQAPFTATWENEATRLDLVMLSDVQRLIVADAPGWRSDSGTELNAPPIQQILAERKSNDGKTASTFVALMVPYTSEKSPVLSARLIRNDVETGAVAVEVKFSDRTDTIISTLDGRESQFRAVSLEGKFGFVSTEADGTARQAYLLDGSRLRCGELEVTLPGPSVSRNVKSVSGRTFHLAESLPRDVDVKGLYVLAGETGYEIESATQESVTVRDYPATECDQIRILNSVWVDAAESKEAERNAE